jgi:hypothetical protein
MKVAILAIVCGALAFVFALPPAYLLADLKFEQAPMWAAIAAATAMVCVCLWKLRNPRQRITGIVAISIAVLSFLATVSAYALDADRPWVWRIFFVGWCMIFVSGYAAIAALFAVKVVEGIERDHAA